MEKEAGSPEIRLAADVNFNHDIIQGLKRRLPIDIVFIQQIGMGETPDEQVLEWATTEERILLTHDKQTMLDIAYLRLALEERTPAVVYVPQTYEVGRAIADLELLLGASLPDELWNRVIWLPL